LSETAGFKVNSPRNALERGGTVVIDVPSGAEVTKELLRRNILVDYRPGAGIRAAPHFYSTDEELEVTIREIQAICAEKSISSW
jgi:kynureninase